MGFFGSKSIALVAVVAGFAGAVRAANIGWSNSLGGEFSSGTNWLGGLAPGADDIATFDLGLGNAYTATLNGAETNSQLFLLADNLTLDLHGESYALTDTGYMPGDYSMQIGSALGGTLNLTSSVKGGSLSTQYMAVAANAGDTGTLNVSGPLTWDSGKCMRIGDAGNGTLNITGGATVSSLISSIGDLSTGVGAAKVSGAGSSLNASDYLYVGSYGSGTLSIQNGASVTSTTTYIGQYGTGSATLTDPGSTWNAGYLDVAYNAPGSLTVANGASLTDSDGYVSCDSGSPGVVTVSGANTTWTNTDTLYIGLASATTLNISGGLVSVTNVFGISNQAGTQVNLSGGTLRVGSITTDNNPSLFLGNGTTTGWTGGTLDITGSNLSVSATGPLGGELNVGTGKALRVSGNGDVLAIAAGSSLNAGGGTIYANTLNNAGTLSLPKGSAVEVVNPLVNTGLIDVSGGTLQLDDGVSGSTVRQEIFSAYDDGTWDGSTGITSTAAENDPTHATALAYITSGSTTKIIYTWYGDADGSGTVTPADAADISLTGTTWQTGDFNYDGVVNADDFSLFSLGAIYGSSNISARLPEPAGLAVLLPLAGILWRRKRQKI